VIARGDIYYGAAAGLFPALRDGGSAFEHVHGTGLFDYLASHPDKEAEFQGSMMARSRQEAAAVIAAYDFEGFRRVVDVGGGYGILLSAILTATPTLRGLLFERPEVVDRAREQLSTRGLLSRCDVVAGDFFVSVPAEGDAYVLSRVIHDWDDAAAARILANCRAAMAANAKLLLVEAVVPPRAHEQPGAIRMDLHMLTLLRGRERTVGEYQALLGEAGLELQRVVPALAAAGLCVLEAATRSPRPGRDGQRGPR
jgi:hypothetical protein